MKLTDELCLSWGGVFQKAKQTLQRGAEMVDAYYVPDLKWRLDCSGSHGIFQYSGNVNYTSERSIVLAGDKKTLQSVYELGLMLSATVTSGLSLSLTGYDLTDEQRPDQFGFTISDQDYPSPGRRFSVSARYKLF